MSLFLLNRSDITRNVWWQQTAWKNQCGREADVKGGGRLPGLELSDRTSSQTNGR